MIGHGWKCESWIADTFRITRAFSTEKINKSDFYGLKPIKRFQKGSVTYLGYPQNNEEISTLRQISTEKNPQTGQNPILAAIFGGADIFGNLRSTFSLGRLGLSNCQFISGCTFSVLSEVHCK